MKKAMLVVALLVVLAGTANAGWVNGYFRSDGTYVRGHYRSNPDGIKWNNYGPSRNSMERLNPYLRDQDRDGIPNMMDMFDNRKGRWQGY